MVACTPYKYVMLIYDVTINGLYIYHDITASGGAVQVPEATTLRLRPEYISYP